MKKIYLVLILLASFTTTIFSRGAGAGFSSSGNVGIDITTTQIKSTSFGGSTDTTYSIASAGRYILKDTVSFNASGADTVIDIAASNVVLDLSGQTLINQDGNLTSDVIGINIGNNVDNVTIKNGQLKDFSGESIKIGTSCTNITIENVHIDSCFDSAISFSGSSGSEIIGATVKNCTIANNTGAGNSGSAAYGLYITNAEGILIQDCEIYGMKTNSSSNNSYGCYVNSGTNITLRNVYSGNHDGASTYGFYVTSGAGVQLYDCYSSGSYSLKSSGDGAVGFYIASSQGCLIDSCVSMGHQAPFAAYGVYLSSSTGTVVRDTKAIGHKLHDQPIANSICTGFYSTAGVSNTWDSCEAYGNTAGNLATSIVSGFQLNSGEYQSTMVNCIARGNGDINKAGKSYGFWLKNENIRYCQISNCSAISNCSSGSSGAIGFYDDTPTTTTNLFIDNFGYGNVGSSTIDNYSVNISPGTFNETEADIGGILDLANKPLYYNVSITA